MLFDLRGRGRRRTVQVIYLGLALLMGVGLVGLGVGGGLGSGGILSSLSGNEGSSGASFSGQIKKAQKLTREQPRNLGAWEELIKAQLHQAGGEAYVTQAGVTSKGKELFAQVASSWSSYLALNPPSPSPELAQQLVRVLGEEGLNEPSATVQALQIVVAARPPSASLYGELALYAYKAGNTRVGDLAGKKAINLAPANQRAELKTELAEIKKNPNGTATTPSSEATPSTSGQTLPTTQGASGTVTAAPTKTSGKKK